jgi:hypothetical protein
MAIVINRVLRDGASTACFEVTNDSGGEEETVIDTASLSGAGDLNNHEIIITRVVGTVAAGAAVDFNHVTLSWGDGTEFLHLPLGTSDIDIPFQTPNDAGNNDADVVVTASAGTLFTLRIFVKKMIGYPLSMGHAANRP